MPKMQGEKRGYSQNLPNLRGFSGLMDAVLTNTIRVE
jgi:hypothetical protein